MMLMVMGMLMPMLINREWDAIADSKDAAVGDTDADSMKDDANADRE